MLARLHHASSRLLAPARLHNGTRLNFSNSAVVSVRLAPGRSPRRDDDNDDEAPISRSFKALQEFESAEENEDDEPMWKSNEEEKGEEDSKAGQGSNKRRNDFARFQTEIAPKFLHAKSCNWLSPNRPFPLNPSFKPPPPLSDAFRTRLYRAYLANPEINSVRALAARHQLGIKRVDAIFRLKGMEATWKKDHKLQTGFQAGMENLLGVEYERPVEDVEDEEPKLVQPAREADQQADTEKARQRYQRLFWETVDEGKEPVMPGILEAGQANSKSKKHKGKTTLVERAPGRPAIKFIDIGEAFVDQQGKARREREGTRRSALRARKRQQKQALRA